MVFNISIGVAGDKGSLRAELDATLGRHHTEIDALLVAYDVPRVAGLSARQ